LFDPGVRGPFARRILGRDAELALIEIAHDLFDGGLVFGFGEQRTLGVRLLDQRGKLGL
jgi:hypothetical protein